MSENSLTVELSKLDLNTIMKALNLMRRMNYRADNHIVKNEIRLQRNLIQQAIANHMEIPPYTNKDYWEMQL